MSKAAEVRRDDEVVTITVRCSEIYEAMQLYDELTRALDDGGLTLTVVTPAAGARRKKEGGG